MKSGTVTNNELIIPSLNRHHLLSVFECQAKNNNITTPLSASITLDLNCKFYQYYWPANEHYIMYPEVFELEKKKHFSRGFNFVTNPLKCCLIFHFSETQQGVHKTIERNSHCRPTGHIRMCSFRLAASCIHLLAIPRQKARSTHER